MRKIFPVLTFPFFFAALLAGAECRRHTVPFVGPDERGEPFLIQNGEIGYVITFRYTNPTPSAAPSVLVGMPLPVNLSGFSRRDFTWLVVNGIDSRRLEPKKYEIFNSGNRAGVHVHYNFDGVKMIQTFQIRDGSPLLEMIWTRSGGTPPEEKIKTLRLHFNVMPCIAARKSDSYDREVVTPRGVSENPDRVRRKRLKLDARDVWLILQDAKYQAGTHPRAAGPVLLVPDWKGLASGNISFGTHQNVFADFTLDTGAECWRFGLLDSDKKRSNGQFREFVDGIPGLPVSP
ncbi:MAG: hypothetical protein IJS01_11990 [Lentisphaeria bacterium]|nr:hypothetical protein [Lentisphaeria bacterium]